MNITGTNDLATVSSSTTEVSEGNVAAALNTSGQLVIADADAGEVSVRAQDVAGTYGTFHVNTNGSWTYTGNGAHNELTAGQKVSDSITVTSFDGTGTGTITVNITGTNDAPVFTSAATPVTLVQGAGAVTDVSAGVIATDVDGTLQYSLVGAPKVGGVDLFTINGDTGVISLTAKGSQVVSGLAGEGTLPEYSLQVNATDNNGAVASETVSVSVNMAVHTGGTTASLPGSMSDWSIAPSTSNTFVLTNHADPLIQVSLPSTVTSLSFTGGDSVTLSNNGTIGTVTYSPGTATTHTITVAPTTEGTLTVLASGGVTVEGAASTDGVQIHTNVDVTNLNATFGAVTNNHITMHTSYGDTVMSDVEYVKFDNATVRIVGAGGYASLTEATAAALAGDVIYVTDSNLANGAYGVINNNNVSIYIANGETAKISMAPSIDSTGGEVRVYGDHSFSLTGSAGNDTIHDYTNIASGMTNTIRGGDGADNIVAHNNTLGTELIYGDGGNDILVGGAGAQISGGDGSDILLALGGAASLSGGAGNDVLLNAYASTDSAAKAVTMSGGAGSDTFGLIGTNIATAGGTMKTVVADLATGDAIDLSFLEKTASGVSTDQSITSTADLSGKATMTTGGTTLNLNSFVATSSESNTLNDVNSNTTGGTMVISNATLTKAAAAITAGTATETGIDFNSTFGHLTDTYNHH